MLVNGSAKSWLGAGFITFVLLAALAYPAQAGQSTQPPVVRAVMLWLEDCGHCQYVLEEVLPPLQAQYGEQFEIILVQLVTTEDFDRLYQTAVAFGIAKEKVGVPFLVIGEQALMGSRQISEELPGLIEQYLAQGGVDYPDLPSLADILPTIKNTADSTTPTEVLCNPTTPCPADLPMAQTTTPPAVAQLPESHPPEQVPDNPIQSVPYSNGFTLAMLVMLGMVASLLFAGVAFVRFLPGLPRILSMRWTEPAFPLLCLVGLGVAGYLAYVETQAVQAICGPVGDCNTVQSSPYARLFGVLPVGVLGILGYLAILAGWLYPRLRRDRWARYAPLAILGMTVFGVLFSLVLTFLEIFVIKAVCIWCITSAVIMTLLLLLSMKPALWAMQALKDAESTVV